MGRRKLPLQKIEDEHQRQIIFSKRRLGLFRKASYLCSKGYYIAIIAISSVGNAFVFAHPHIDTVIQRYVGDACYRHPIEEEEVAEVMEEEADASGLHDGHANTDADEELSLVMEEEASVEGGASTSNGVVERREEMLEEEATKANVLEDEKFWWNKSFDHLRLKDMRELEKATADLRDKVRERAEFLSRVNTFTLGLHS